MRISKRSTSRPVTLAASALAACAVAAALVSCVAAVAAPDTRAGRIANGTDVTDARHDAAWPFLVSLGSAGDSPLDGHSCGGSLITPKLVLTAAHCVEDVDDENDVVRSKPRTLRILAGTPTLSAAASGQLVVVEDILVHPKWNARRSVNDVAVLRLAAPVKLNERVKLVPVVPPARDALWGNGAGIAEDPLRGPWVAGWGNTVSWKGEAYPDVLKENTLPIVPDAACAAKPAPGLGNFEGGINMAQFVCAGVPDSDTDPSNGSTAHDTCSGDSGGPLVVRDETDAPYVAALVSYGGACGAANYTAYTRLASYRPWIASIGAAAGTGPGGIKPPVGIKTLGRTKRSVTIGWRAAQASAKSFTIYAGLQGGSMIKVTTTKQRTFTLTDLDANSEYEFWISARSANGNESPVRKVKAVTA